MCVDAASYPQKPAYAVSAVSHQLGYITAATIQARTSIEAEEAAIALAISTTAAEVILSDSKTAIRNYSKGRVHEPALKILNHQTPSDQLSSSGCPRTQAIQAMRWPILSLE